MNEIDPTTRARLDEVLASHARARGINPRDHGVVAIADLVAVLAVLDAQAARLAAVSRLVEEVLASPWCCERAYRRQRCGHAGCASHGPWIERARGVLGAQDAG